MAYLITFIFCWLHLSSILLSTAAQTAELEAIYSVSDALNSFALKLLAQTSNLTSDTNVALSPYTVWTLLTIISEGAQGNTARELENVLNVPPQNGKDIFRRNYKSLSKYLMQGANGVELQISNAIFTTNDHQLNHTFKQTSENFYGVETLPVNFDNKLKASQYINAYIKAATKDRILNFIDSDDLSDATIFLTSALFFKGQWKWPFNKTATHVEDFFDETKNKIGEVKMMYQSAPFPYSRIDYLHAHAVQLDYGQGKMSMFVILPQKDHTLTETLNLIASVSISKLVNILADAEQLFMDEDVDVYLPRFRIQSDLNLNIVLEQMGIKAIFDDHDADLLGIFPDYLYVSKVIQRAEIDVNEEGTVAAAASGAALTYKTITPVFRANRPFAYVIIDKETRSIVFAGKVTNPNTLIS